MKDNKTEQLQENQILVVDLKHDYKTIKGLASKTRIDILMLIQDGPKNIREISSQLSLPQLSRAAQFPTKSRGFRVRHDFTELALKLENRAYLSDTSALSTSPA